MEIAQNAKKVVFCGTFDAQGSKLSWNGSALRIEAPGKVRKLVSRVERITFAGDYARLRAQEVLYVTERAVFRLNPDGIQLVEVAPGIDIEADVIGRMDFRPIIRYVKPMDPSCFL